MSEPNKKTLLITKEDYPQLSKIHQACFGLKGWDVFTLQKMLEISGGYALKLPISSDKKNIAGFILLQNTIDSAEIITFCIDPEQQNKGFGLALLQDALLNLYDLGIDLVTLEVSEDNGAAQKIYKKTGFSKISERKNYYSTYTNQAKNAYLFQVSLKNAKFIEDLK